MWFLKCKSLLLWCSSKNSSTVVSSQSFFNIQSEFNEFWVQIHFHLWCLFQVLEFKCARPFFKDIDINGLIMLPEFECVINNVVLLFWWANWVRHELQNATKWLILKRKGVFCWQSTCKYYGIIKLLMEWLFISFPKEKTMLVNGALVMKLIISSLQF